MPMPPKKWIKYYVFVCCMYIYGTGLQPPLPPPAMVMVPRVGCTIMQGISASPPPLWGGLGAVCMYLRRLVGIGMYVCGYVCMYVM